MFSCLLLIYFMMFIAAGTIAYLHENDDELRVSCNSINFNQSIYNPTASGVCTEEAIRYY
jgi:hypothetical protein